MITGAGIDLFAVARLQRAIVRQGTHLLDELFSPVEQAACAVVRNPAACLAARFAAKEACFKALGTGKTGSMAWRDIETREDGRGGLTVVLQGETARVASALGVESLHVAISLTRDLAAAWAVAEGTLARGGADVL